MGSAGAIEVRAATCREFGAPLVIERLRLAPPQGREIRVRVIASAICGSDIKYMDGKWGGAPPAVFGHEVAGIVSDVGPDAASSFSLGDRVLVSLLRSCGQCALCDAGTPTLCSAEFPSDREPRLTDRSGRPVAAGLRVGGFAESVVVDRSQAAKIPDGIPSRCACLVSCGVLTGYGAAANIAKVRAGQSVAVVGCGGVGINCVQGAALAGGSPVVAIDIGAGKLGLAREFGATAAVDASCEGLPGAALRHAPNGGFDHVIAAAGSAKAIEEALALVAPGGTLVVAGMPPDGDPVSFDAAALAHSARRILGCKMGGARLSEDVTVDARRGRC